MEALFRSLLRRARDGAARGRAAAGRYALGAISGGLAMIAAMAAVGLGLLSLWFLLVPLLGTAGAALILAGILGVLCLVLLALACSILRHGRRKPITARDPDVALSVTYLFHENKGALLLAALAAGFGAGSGPGRSIP